MMVEERRREISSLTNAVSDGVEVLSAQADRLAGARRKEKASAGFVRNDGVWSGWLRSGNAGVIFPGGLRLG